MAVSLILHWFGENIISDIS